ncbi:MAG: hypothetical protein IKD93_00500 [Firmicutes bacterium]|nr:hypothetical protein [Bacillota bacterium]
MLAAIAVEGIGPDPLIPEKLDQARALYIMELEDGRVGETLPVSGEGEAARLAAERGCRALICGQIGPDARQALREREVLCFDGYLYRVSQVRRMLYTGVMPGI